MLATELGTLIYARGHLYCGCLIQWCLIVTFAIYQYYSEGLNEQKTLWQYGSIYCFSIMLRENVSSIYIIIIIRADPSITNSSNDLIKVLENKQLVWSALDRRLIILLTPFIVTSRFVYIASRKISFRSRKSTNTNLLWTTTTVNWTRYPLYPNEDSNSLLLYLAVRPVKWKPSLYAPRKGMATICV